MLLTIESFNHIFVSFVFFLSLSFQRFINSLSCYALLYCSIWLLCLDLSSWAQAFWLMFFVLCFVIVAVQLFRLLLSVRTSYRFLALSKSIASTLLEEDLLLYYFGVFQPLAFDRMKWVRKIRTLVRHRRCRYCCRFCCCYFGYFYEYYYCCC